MYGWILTGYIFLYNKSFPYGYNMYLEFWIHIISWKNLLIYLGFYFLQAYFTIYINNLHYEKFQDGTVKCIEDEIPFEVPEGWEWTRLRSIIHFIRNGATIKQYGDAKGLPITRIETIASGTIDRNRFGYANIFEVGKYESYILKDYDILMSHINSPKHLGKCALYEHEGDEKIIHGMNLLSIRTFSCSLSKYMCIVFRSTVFKDFVWEHMKQAVNQASITTTSISNSLFPLPPEEEQKRIVDFYDDVNKYVTAIDIDKDKIIQDISLVKSKILDLAIRGKLVPQDPNDEPASVLLERIRAEKEELIKQGKIKRDKKESVIFKGDDNSYYGIHLPDGWSWASLREISLSISDGSHNPPPDNGSGIPLLSAANINDNSILMNEISRWITNEEWKIENQRTNIEVGDVLLTIVGSIGRSAVVQNNNHFALQRSVAVIKPYLINPLYLMHIVQAPQIQKWLNDNSKGTAQKGIYLNALSLMTIPIPPLAEQVRIVEQISSVYNQLNKILEALT